MAEERRAQTREIAKRWEPDTATKQRIAELRVEDNLKIAKDAEIVVVNMRIAIDGGVMTADALPTFVKSIMRRMPRYDDAMFREYAPEFSKLAGL